MLELYMQFLGLAYAGGGEKKGARKREREVEREREREREGYGQRVFMPFTPPHSPLPPPPSSSSCVVVELSRSSVCYCLVH